MRKNTKPRSKQMFTNEYLVALKKEGVTEEDIMTWWSLTEEERTAVRADDLQSRFAVFSDCARKGMSSKDAGKVVRMTFPIYGNILEAKKEEGEDRILPYELKDKVNRLLEDVLTNDYAIAVFKEKLKMYSSYNAYIRAVIKGNEKFTDLVPPKRKDKLFCPWCGARAISSSYVCSKCGKSLQPKAGFMYTAVTCPKCQKEIENPKSFCPHCGLNLNTGETQSIAVKSGKKEIEIEAVLPNESKGKMNPLSVIAFILSLIAPFSGFVLLGIIGFVLGIVSLNQVNALSLRGKGLSIAAIVIGAIWGIFWAFVKALS